MNNFDNKYALHKAIKESYSFDKNYPIEDEIYEMINKDSVNQKDEEGKTPLYWAIYMNNTRIVNILLKNGADSNMKYDEQPLLHKAIINESPVILNSLVEYKCDVNAKDKYGYTALYWAIRSDRKETRQEKEERLKDERKLVLSEPTQRHWVEKDCIKFTRTLLENGADSNLASYNNTPPLNTAVNTGNIDLVQLLLEYKADIYKSDKYGNNPYNIAITENNLDILELLLEVSRSWIQNPDPILNDRLPLFYAVDNINLDLIQLLIKYGADITQKDKNGCYLQSYAYYIKDPEIHKLIYVK